MFRCLTNSWLGADLKQASHGKLLKYGVILNIWYPGGTLNGAYCLMITCSAGVFFEHWSTLEYPNFCLGGLPV